MKLFAVIFMLIDHFGAIVLKNGVILSAPYSMFSDAQFSTLLSLTEICHILGRIAFPIFCFLLVEGFLHTHNVKKYLLHLGLFALISEPVYDLALTGTLVNMQEQNVLFTLLLGLLILTIILVLIHFYNGKRGLKMKYFFYAFYPAHLLLFWLLGAYCLPS